MSGDKRDHRGPVVDPAGGRAPGGPPRGIGGPRGGGGGAGDGGPRWRSAQAAGPAAWVMSGLGAGGRPLAKVPSFEVGWGRGAAWGEEGKGNWTVRGGCQEVAARIVSQPRDRCGKVQTSQNWIMPARASHKGAQKMEGWAREG
eukprot:evm.model.scf_258.9 EVM.evm.TU.scf_258.9   scf_258:107093-107524(+)